MNFGVIGTVFEFDQIDVLTGTVLGHLQQIDDTGETGTSGERGGDIGDRDLAKIRDLDGAGSQAIAAADLDVRPLPNAHAASDLSADDRLLKALGEGHRHDVEVSEYNTLPDLDPSAPFQDQALG
ncbi:MAG TPA: hypothetical protein VGI79_03420 [Caulobacteraceae bacterium]